MIEWLGWWMIPAAVTVLPWLLPIPQSFRTEFGFGEMVWLAGWSVAGVLAWIAYWILA